MASTVQIGDKLRDSVVDLLKSAGKKRVEPEFFVGGKKADVYYEDERQFGGIIKVAIECKNYDHKLSLQKFSAVISEYSAQKEHFDHLIILSKVGITSQSELTIRSKGWISVITFDEFYFQIVDFKNYLQSISKLFNQYGLERYYVSSREKGGRIIEDLIKEWSINTDNHEPIAILGGYGMGKTSLAHKLVKDLSDGFFNGNVGRIPIYIRLGDIVSAFSIESLICTNFSSTYLVKGFSYPLFFDLNSKGHFLIIFDGFDEMKHAMPANSFKRMFSEICKLTRGKSKVIVLGRPNAFNSEEEKLEILHAKSRLGDQYIEDFDGTEFSEIEISDFSSPEAEMFIESYISWIRENRSYGDERASDEFLRRRIAELASESYRDLIRRPVHAKMLVELAMSTTLELKVYVRFSLYEKFINLFYSREGEKAARKDISQESRREFIENVAWTFWKAGGRRSFHVSELRRLEWRQYFDENIHKQNDDVLRELLIGSVLEKKEGDHYYFPHRSFQEFLASSKLLSEKTNIRNELADIATSTNKEILSFLEEGPRFAGFLAACNESLASFRGAMSQNFINFISKHNGQISRLSSVFGMEESPVLSFIRGLSYSTDPIFLDSLQGQRYLHDQSFHFLFGLGGILLKERDAYLENDITAMIVDFLHQFLYEQIRSIKIDQKKMKINSSLGVAGEETLAAFRILLSGVHPVFGGNNELSTLGVDIKKFKQSFHDELRRIISLEYFPSENESQFDIPLLRLREKSVVAQKPEDYASVIRNFWRCNPRPSLFTYVAKKSEPQKKRETISLKNGRKDKN